MNRRKAVACGAIAAAAIVAAIAVPVALTGGSRAPQASVAACTKAYPAWFLASAAAGKTTPAPPECQGLTDAQVTAISVAYLQGKDAR
jgi:hypothetical protein